MIPDPMTLKEYCDKNDLTIILTHSRTRFGFECVRAELQGSLLSHTSGSEEASLSELTKMLGDGSVDVNGKMYDFPMLSKGKR